MLAREQHKEHVVNVIKELKQQIIFIENKLQELSIFYITNNNIYDYELAKTFFDNLKNFITINDIPSITSDVNNYKFINYYNNDKYNNLLTTYLDYSKAIINNSSTIPDELETLKQNANECFNFICNEEEDKLTHLMLIIEKKLKCYENLMKLYPECESEKPKIKNIMELYPEQNKKKQHYFVITSVIFFIMIMFSVIAVTTLVLMKDNTDNNIMLHHMHHKHHMHHMQCTRLIDKHNKLKDIII